jgi:hypothetical protein
MNKNRTCDDSGTDLTRARSVAVHLTAVRGKVRRLPQGVEKQRGELIANQLKERVPAPYLARQIALMGAR